MISNWNEKAKEIGAIYVVIMFDPEDRERYPVYLFPKDNLKKELSKLRLSEGKQKILDVIKVKNKSI
jgi:hypothetical protein